MAAIEGDGDVPSRESRMSVAQRFGGEYNGDARVDAKAARKKEQLTKCVHGGGRGVSLCPSFASLTCGLFCLSGA